MQENLDKNIEKLFKETYPMLFCYAQKIVGYDDAEDGFKVKAVTYSGYKWLDFEGLWNTGCKPTGGMIIYTVNEDAVL